MFLWAVHKLMLHRHCMLPGTGGASSWRSVGPSTPPSFVSGTSMASNATTGKPLLAFDLYQGLQTLNVHVWALAPGPATTPGSWSKLGKTLHPEGPYGVAVAIDSMGRPLVGFQEEQEGYRVTVMVFSGGAWQLLGGKRAVTGPAVRPEGVLRSFDLATSSTGQVYIVYQDATLSGALTALQYGPDSGNKW
jgi:hypothetical protein